MPSTSTAAAAAIEPIEAVTPTEAPPPQAAAPRRSLRDRVMRGSVWTAAGYFTSVPLRFASNIILARLLVPQDFGLMALVTLFLTALQMFSDLGLGAGIIHNPRGEDAKFYNTAWTIQAIRGMGLFTIACLLAYPVSLVWGAPLRVLLPVAAVTALIQGFNSTRLFSLNRKLEMRYLTMLDLSVQVTSIVVMVVWALVISRSVWALVAGTIASVTLRCVGSHLFLPGARNHFTWDRKAAHELVRFGKWLFVSTVITFLAGQVDKLTYGALMTKSAMGLFWIGVMIADIFPQMVLKMGNQIGFPALAELHRVAPEKFYSRLLRMRMVLVLTAHAGLLVTMGLATIFLHVAYKPIYLSAGWVVQLLAVNSLAGMINTSYGSAYLASGSTFSNMVTVAGQLLIVVPATLVGYFLAGSDGFLVGLGVSQWLKHPLDAFLAGKLGFWQPKFDLTALIVSSLLAVTILLGSSHILHRAFVQSLSPSRAVVRLHSGQAEQVSPSPAAPQP